MGNKTWGAGEPVYNELCKSCEELELHQHCAFRHPCPARQRNGCLSSPLMRGFYFPSSS